MKNRIASIETAEDTTYNVFIKERLPFGFFGEGNTIEEAKQDFIDAYHEMKVRYEAQTSKKIKHTFIFEYDVQSFLKHYSTLFSMPALEKLTGINQKQLHHYRSGLRKPREAQRKKIETALHKLGHELTAIRL